MDPDRRRLICEQAAAKTGLVASSVEKDFWVTWTLEKLFALPEWGMHLTFKGGTSLAKVWKLIERFSEDIDIVIDRAPLGFDGEHDPAHAVSGKQKKNRLDELKAAAQDCVQSKILPALKETFEENLPADLLWSLGADPADTDRQTLLFSYPTVFPDHPSYLRQIVKIEMGARSDIDPAEQAGIESVISEAFPDLFPEKQVQVRAVLPVRTFWEKAMLLHEETFRPAEKSRKKYMARHYYDLYRLIKAGIADQAAADLHLFQRIVEHREVYFRYSWVDYSTLKPGSLRLVPDSEHLPAWQSDYEGMQSEMFYGEVPRFEEVMGAVGKFATQFNRVH